MIKTEKTYVIIAAVIFSIFLIIVLIDRHIAINDAKNSIIIDKQLDTTIIVNKDYYNRGVLVFNDKYYVMAARLTKSSDIKKISYIKTPYKLIKKGNNDTIKLTNKDTTLIMVLE